MHRGDHGQVTLAIDHLVIAASTVEDGAAWIESQLGVAPSRGGRHDFMATHNRLLGLGPETYLEVIAIDPGAATPPRPRWFALDQPAMRERLERGPALIHWVARVDDIASSVKAAPVDLGEVIPAARGDYRWRITVPRDGSLPAGGIFPTLIEWETPRPAAALPDSGCRLESLTLAHPRAASIEAALRYMGLSEREPLHIADGESRLEAAIRTPRGLALLA